MNCVIMLVRNNQAITREAVESVLAQDVPNRLLIIDNRSTDGATQYIHSLLGVDERVTAMFFSPGKGVAESWNIGLRYVWEQGGEHALVVNNDVVLRPDMYSCLLADGGEFVTGVGVRGKVIRAGGFRALDHTGREVFPASMGTAKRDHPDFSAFMIRKSVWDAVGEFDEGFKMGFGEDGDYHVRMHKAGIRAYSLDLPFFHYGSATIKGMSEANAKLLSAQAGRNREYFKAKWGCAMGSTEYYHGIFGHDAPGDDALAMT